MLTEWCLGSTIVPNQKSTTEIVTGWTIDSPIFVHVLPFENQHNQRSHWLHRGKRCSARYKGVTRFRQKWQAYIRHNGRKRHLGTYEIEEDAARAYNVAAIQLHGEFARLNEIVERHLGAHV